MFDQLRVSYVLVLSVVMGTLLGITRPATAVVVTFPDANLETAVRDWLGIPAPTPITDTDMAAVARWFSADGRSISNIQGLEYGTELTWLLLPNNQISDISPVTGLTELTGLHVSNNQISDISAVSGLTNLTHLDLRTNQIETMDLSGADLSSLERFGIGGNPLTSVLLEDATLSQTVLNTLMDGGDSFHTGIAELSGVLDLDMSGVDFTGISDLSTMYTMDDLETLLLTGASNLDGSQVVPLTDELDSMNWLDVRGLWTSFDTGTQNSLYAWDAIEANTLVVPEPSSIALLLCGLVSLALLKRRR